MSLHQGPNFSVKLHIFFVEQDGPLLIFLAVHTVCCILVYQNVVLDRLQIDKNGKTMCTDSIKDDGCIASADYVEFAFTLTGFYSPLPLPALSLNREFQSMPFLISAQLCLEHHGGRRPVVETPRDVNDGCIAIGSLYNMELVECIGNAWLSVADWLHKHGKTAGVYDILPPMAEKTFTNPLAARLCTMVCEKPVCWD